MKKNSLFQKGLGLMLALGMFTLTTCSSNANPIPTQEGTMANPEGRRVLHRKQGAVKP